MIGSADWSPAAGRRLEPNALLAATELDRNVLVVAGPGAGKTEMLAQRADFLLRTGACRFPRRILAISFKTDAAQNLRSRVAERCGAELAHRLDSYTFHAFAKRLIDNYRVVLTGQDALDHDYGVGLERIERRQISFDDMVPLATEIVRSSRFARNAIRNTYGHVFLDEFQDCTDVQYQFLRAAFGQTAARHTAVGDSKQRIMRYAGALDGIFDRFATDSDAQVLYLYQNFRSAPRIRRVHNEMVKVMEPSAAVRDQELVGDQGVVELLEFATCVDEADYLADRIAEWVSNEGIPASQIAILVRQQPHLYAKTLTDALDARGVAYRNEQTLQDDFAQPAGQLILDFIATTVHKRQPAAYQRLMETLASSTGDDEADARQAARWRAILKSSRAAVQSSLTTDDASEVLIAITRAFLHAVGDDHLISLSPEYATSGRLQQVVDSVLQRVGELAQRIDGSLDDLTQVTDDGAVRILTVHKSKGLEFDTVVVFGVEEQTYWGDPGDARSTFFVAVSRAIRRLVVTTTSHRAKPAGASHWSVRRARHREFLSYVERVAEE